jgi:hypothetical protein
MRKIPIIRIPNERWGFFDIFYEKFISSFLTAMMSAHFIVMSAQSCKTRDYVHAILKDVLSKFYAAMMSALSIIMSPQSCKTPDYVHAITKDVRPKFGEAINSSPAGSNSSRHLPNSSLLFLNSAQNLKSSPCRSKSSLSTPNSAQSVLISSKKIKE